MANNSSFLWEQWRIWKKYYFSTIIPSTILESYLLEKYSVERNRADWYSQEWDLRIHYFWKFYSIQNLLFENVNFWFSFKFSAFSWYPRRQLFNLDRRYCFRSDRKCCRIFDFDQQEKHQFFLPSWLQDHWLLKEIHKVLISFPQSLTQNCNVSKDSNNSQE